MDEDLQNQGAVDTGVAPPTETSGSTEASAPTTSLRDSLKDAFDKKRAEQESSGSETKPGSKAATGAERDQQTGRYAGKKPDAAAANATAAPNGAAAGAAPGVDAIKPPQGWSEASKGKFATLDPDLQKEIMKRENDIAKALTGPEHQIGTETLKVLKPFDRVIREQFGNNPHQALHDMLQTAHALRYGPAQQKAAVIRELAEKFNVDLSAGKPADGFTDPTIASLTKQVSDLSARLAREDETKHQQTQGRIKSDIDAFAQDPKNVHFQQVKSRMAALIRSGQAKDLQSAYDQATWMDPDIRSTLIEAEKAGSQAQRVADNTARAERARHASGSLRGSPGLSVAPASAPATNLRDELRRAMRNASGRA